MSRQMLKIQDSCLTKPSSFIEVSQPDFSMHKAEISKLKRLPYWSGILGAAGAAVAGIPFICVGSYEMLFVGIPIAGCLTYAMTLETASSEAAAIHDQMVSQIVGHKIDDTIRPFDEWDELFAPFHTKNAQRVLEKMES